jgi:Lrp/AsnC family transcriptional regulator, regulator for asnA, asnC and gidA
MRYNKENMMNNKVTVDSLDKQIAKLLAKDGRLSAEQLAKQLQVSAATVRRRMDRLMKNDMLRIVAVVNPADFGYSIRAVLALNVLHDQLESTIQELNKQQEIQWMATSTGRYNVLVATLFPSLDALSDFIVKVLPAFKGVKDVETFICLNQVKENFNRLSTPFI